jgi:hypothetical protein
MIDALDTRHDNFWSLELRIFVGLGWHTVYSDGEIEEEELVEWYGPTWGGTAERLAEHAATNPLLNFVDHWQIRVWRNFRLEAELTEQSPRLVAVA